MTTRQEEFQKRLLATFRVEAEELVHTVASGLIELEKHSGDLEAAAAHAERAFRAAHSLKGAARAVDLTLLEGLCQAAESLLREIKRGALAPGREHFDLLHESVSAVSAFLEGQPQAELRVIRATENLARVGQASSSPAGEPFAAASPLGSPRLGASGLFPGPTVFPPLPAPTSQPTGPVPPPPAPLEAGEAVRAAGWAETEKMVRIPSKKMDTLLQQAEEFLYIKLSYHEKARELGRILDEFHSWRRHWREQYPTFRALRREGGPAELSPLLDFLEWNDELLRKSNNAFRDFHRGCALEARGIARQIDEHLEEMREAVMLPFASLTAPLPKMVRDLARELHKEVELVVEGEDVQVDKRILDDLRDPLVHLVRNGVDHGVELPARRKEAGKSAAGRVFVKLSRQDGRTAILTVADDGGGVDLARVRERACSLGLGDAGSLAAMPVDALLDLVFRSEFSTAPLITTLSGRGLGLAIVQEKVERLGGMVSLENQPGRGAAFHLQVPLSVSTLRGLVLRVGDQRLILPTRSLDSLIRRKPAEIGSLENREAVRVGGRWVPWVPLREVLGLPPASAGPEPTHLKAFVLRSGEVRIAFPVDDILGEDEILLKPLGKLLLRVRNVAGAAVMGSGEIVPVLNPDDVVRAALRLTRGPRPARPEVESGRAARSLLVVDDSITSRVLLKNILEASGYRVATAVDGQDAWIALNEERFDAVVTDLEMPRLNGFDLTDRIRRDPGLAHLPVVLVTGLESPDDRERGIDVGASAYIIKSNFDQSNLLDVLHRLL